MPTPPDPFTLTGRHVVLEPLDLAHVEALVAAASQDRATYGWTAVPDGADAMTDYVSGLLRQRDRAEVVPMVQRRVADGAVIGCTRYMDLRWWGSGPFPSEVEIGGTWLAASAQRTAVNTEAKLLLFTHAFEEWGVQRVQLCTDARNIRSRDAIARVGARFEGVLRSHRLSHAPGEAGAPRDSAMFAVTASEWPTVRESLEQRLSRS